MVPFDNLTKSFHKHLFEHVNDSYFCYFSKLSVSQDFSHLLWVQPIWNKVPVYPYCHQIVPVTLKCNSIIVEDQLLTNLRAMSDFCVDIYKIDFSPYATDSNTIPLYAWNGTVIASPTPIGYAKTFVKEVTELPVAVGDTVAVVNIAVNILVCCYQNYVI